MLGIIWQDFAHSSFHHTHSLDSLKVGKSEYFLLNLCGHPKQTSRQSPPLSVAGVQRCENRKGSKFLANYSLCWQWWRKAIGGLWLKPVQKNIPGKIWSSFTLSSTLAFSCIKHTLEDTATCVIPANAISSAAFLLISRFNDYFLFILTQNYYETSFPTLKTFFDQEDASLSFFSEWVCFHLQK